MEIPDQIMVPGIFAYFILLVSALYFEDMSIFLFDRSTYSGDMFSYFYDHIGAAWILYSFFYLQILIPGWWHLAKAWRMWYLLELIATYVLFPFMLFFPKSKNNSNDATDDIPTWIGWGDLRIALFIWLTLWLIHGIASFAFAYIIGSIYAIGSLLYKRGFTWSGHQIPFGPFLWLGWLLAVFFHTEILSYGETLSENISYIIRYMDL
jgi:hypothetical protein